MSRNESAVLTFGALLLALYFIPGLGVLFVVALFALYFYDWYLTTFKSPPQDPLYTIKPVYRDISDSDQLANFMYVKRKYLESSHWSNKRSTMLAFHPKCQLCRSPNNLEVHHIAGYNLIPNEPLTCLKVLCRQCHQLQHDYYGYPQTYKEYIEWDAPLYKGPQ